MAIMRVTPVRNMRKVSNESVRSLAPNYYTDPTIFSQEQDSVFAKTWQFAGHVSSLEQPGNYFSFTIAGAGSEVIRKLAVQDRETTVEEDVHLVESVQRGMNSRAYSPGPLVIDPSGHSVNSEHALHTMQG